MKAFVQRLATINMNKEMKFCHYVLLCLLALIFPGSSSVLVLENTSQDVYQVGDSAVIYCVVKFDQETVKKCVFTWVIPSPNDTEDILHIKKYERRIKLQLFNDTFITLTLRNLSISDANNLQCITDCRVNGIFMRNSGKGITLKISDKTEGQDKAGNVQMVTTMKTADLNGTKSSLSWINFLLLSINILVLIAITLVCVSLIKKQMQRKR